MNEFTLRLVQVINMPSVAAEALDTFTLINRPDRVAQYYVHLLDQEPRVLWVLRPELGLEANHRVIEKQCEEDLMLSSAWEELPILWSSSRRS